MRSKKKGVVVAGGFLGYCDSGDQISKWVWGWTDWFSGRGDMYLYLRTHAVQEHQA